MLLSVYLLTAPGVIDHSAFTLFHADAEPVSCPIMQLKDCIHHGHLSDWIPAQLKLTNLDHGDCRWQDGITVFSSHQINLCGTLPTETYQSGPW